jgi:hypothetical protein
MPNDCFRFGWNPQWQQGGSSRPIKRRCEYLYGVRPNVQIFVRVTGFQFPASCILIRATLHRQSSKVGAVCIKVPVRFCAGGDQ